MAAPSEKPGNRRSRKVPAEYRRGIFLLRPDAGKDLPKKNPVSRNFCRDPGMGRVAAPGENRMARMEAGTAFGGFGKLPFHPWFRKRPAAVFRGV